MVKNNKPIPADEKQSQNLERLFKRVDLFDQRLDNIDSVVSAVVERVMKQSITLNLTCSNCGQRIEIALMGTEKPKR